MTEERSKQMGEVRKPISHYVDWAERHAQQTGARSPRQQLRTEETLKQMSE